MGNSFLGEFRRTLEHIAARSGKSFLKFKEKDASRTCSSCLFIHPKIDPIIKEWTCSECGTIHNRDENASQNGYLKIKEEVENLIKMLPGSGYLPERLNVSERYTCRWNGRKIVRAKRTEGSPSQSQEIKSIKENDGSIPSREIWKI